MSSSSKYRKSEPSSLTPQRKHRKLLKDGSGTEVWPESIETVFVKGLREYWDSPWATYSQSRGRSRWRNQFLVDYLHKAGINRSKKQVASHIQVLRNMWKGEPEFYLVAGGEEPLDTPVKLEDHSLMPLDFEETDGASSSSASPDFSPPEFQRDFPPTPGLFHGSYDLGSYPPVSKGSPISSRSRDMVFTTSIPNSLSRYPVDMAPHQSHEQLPVQNTHYALGSYPSIRGQTHAISSSDVLNTSRAMDAYSSHLTSAPTRTTSLCLMADGMAPLSIKLDALMSSQSSTPAALKLSIRLCITPLDDVRSSSTLHGFFGTISLSRLWASYGKCVTRVWSNRSCLSEEVGVLEVSNIELGVVNVLLPDSSLTRCRWLDASVPTNLTQEIVIDGETVMYLLYELVRHNGNPMPSAEFVGYQNHKISPSSSGQASVSSPHWPSSIASFDPHSSPPSRRTNQTSLSNALTSSNSSRHGVAVTSMSY
ncbi:hypothetical protein H0H81_001168 [Sphagnurus paluster]|uniref:TEA domain-containing protein n=1 Tax=Sphagnurus paluster TaxID=117069 RepID=A0A9P7GPN3_9AGAR|nr:hypothetical protein H0H81_001168 [Sphagnurus paluster]